MDKQKDDPGEHGSQEEIEEAIRSLTTPQLGRLRSYAQWRIDVIGAAARGRSWSDLLQEAFTLTLEERRRWNKDAVDFVRHLTGVMLSLSSDWAKSLQAVKHEEPVLDSQVSFENEDGEIISLVENYGPNDPSPEKILGNTELFSAIEQHFSEDERVLEIMDGLIEGLTRSEICEILDISIKEYNAARKRLEREAKNTLRQWREQ